MQVSAQKINCKEKLKLHKKLACYYIVHSPIFHPKFPF